MPDAPCTRCHGRGHVQTRAQNLATLEYHDAIVGCPQCDGKGVVTDADRDRANRNHWNY